MSMKFCNGTCEKISNSLLIEKIRKECGRLLEINLPENYFPGPQPVAIEKENIPKLKSGEYVVCEKTDGERAILLLINIDNKPMCFINNRNNEYMYLPLSVKKEVFEGTIFDGEIVKNVNNEWIYLIHDTLCYNGRNYTNTNHKLRYSSIIDFIVRRYVHKDHDPFKIKTKLFYNYIPFNNDNGGIKTTWEFINKTTEHKIDGLIFTPIYEKIIYGTQNNLFKWKSVNTMDLLVKYYKQTGSINLYYYKKGNKLFKTFEVDTDNYRRINQYYIENELDKKKDHIIEFNYSLNNDVFTPYKIRTDKQKANGETTFLNTLKNITENIKIIELC